jgi:hypothetical protein
MNWWVVAVIAVLLGVAGYIEYRRVPLVQAWAAKHGAYVTSSPDLQLQTAIQGDVSAYGTAGGWGFGFVLTRKMSVGQLRIEECRMRLTKGTAWHIVCSLTSDAALDEAELRAKMPESLINSEVAFDSRKVVWRRRGLLWPGRLDDVYAEAEQLDEVMRRARRE